LRKVKYQNWIYEILNETSPRPSPTGERVEKSPPLVGEGEGGVSKAEPEIELQVKQALARLSPKSKIFIEEFYYQGKGYKEIGRILKLSPKQVEYLHRQATFKLKNLLADFVERKFKIKADEVMLDKSVTNRKSGVVCVICRNPKQAEIEKVISSKKDFQTWGAVLKKLKAKFNLDVKAPQILVGHMKHKS